MSTNVVSAINADAIAANKKSSDEEFKKAVAALFKEYADRADLLNPEGRIDLEVLDQRIHDELATKHVAKINPPDDDDDRHYPEKSSTKTELTAAIFTAGPSRAESEANEVMQTVYGKCQSAVWNRTQSGKRGTVQKLFEAEKLVLIHGTVYRNDNPFEDGIYISTHEEVLLREFWAPRLAKLESLTKSFRDDYDMVKARVPASIDAKIREAIEDAFVEATAKLPVPTLGTSASNGRKAIEK